MRSSDRLRKGLAMALDRIELIQIQNMLLDYSKLIENNTARGAYAWNYAKKVGKEIELMEEAN
jgi:hypothetical protein